MQEREQILFRFGPMGVSIRSRRPGLFVMARRNNTEVVATDRRIYGVRKLPKFTLARHRGKSDQIVFDIPYPKVLQMERADFLAEKVIWLRYQDPEKVKEISIGSGIAWQDRISNLEALLRERLKGRIADA